MTVHPPVVCALFVVFASGCGKTDCAAVEDATKRDWCFYEETVTAAKKGELEPAINAVGQIDDQMVKASAIDKLFLNSTQPLSQEDAKGLCSQLKAPYRDSCLRTWNRPHLWTP